MLKESRQEKYSTALEKVISEIKKNGFSEIYADYDGYEKPTGLTNQRNNHTYIPDVTAKNGSGQKYYFEISKKVSDTTRLVNKWKLLGTLAQIKQSNFKIFAPHGTMRFTRELIDQHNIQAELVKL